MLVWYGCDQEIRTEPVRVKSCTHVSFATPDVSLHVASLAPRVRVLT